MSKIEPPTTLTDVPLAVIKNMIGLATSGFGVVVALAWTEVIKRAVVDLIDPILGKSSGLLSLLIYAVVMTVIAVVITMQLTQSQKKLETITQQLHTQAKALVTKKPQTIRK